MQVELGGYPVTHRAWGSVIKYWQRLRKSSANVLLNSAYKTVCNEDHPWIQRVRYLLESNGFGDHYHQNVDLHDEFYKIFINRLNVQFEQGSLGKIRESNSFTVLHNLKDTFGKSRYIDVIRNADIHLILTRLRTDLNVLKTCKINTDINENCPYGCNEQETVAHLLIRCRKFDKVSFGKIRESNRFTVLHNLKDTLGRNEYIDVIRNADIHIILTRLRPDLNVLKTCKINTDINKNCPYGCNEQETVANLLIKCRNFDEARSEFVSLCAIPRYKLSNEHYMLEYILDLECPGNLVNACCRFISKVYNSREKLHP